MAGILFLLLNGMSVVFLLSVLANFWIDGHRPKNEVRLQEIDCVRKDRQAVFVVTRPISDSAQRGCSVIPFQVPDRDSQEKLEHLRPANTKVEMPPKLYSVR